jgi:hypothetical protein
MLSEEKRWKKIETGPVPGMVAWKRGEIVELM